ncbi:MAG: thiamine diphosphokinase [Actinobacteria bacterium]|nr:thiamine diphosphokinase [Actinomycetota bacterium]MCL5887006.1 thiamine diphosphokinase [Actinomycetota bacterium]
MSRISCLLVAAAPYQEAAVYKEIVDSAKHVIAVDGGVDLCKTLGRVPQSVVGDFDSATGEGLSWATAQGSEIIPLQVDKDESDLDVALGRAISLGFTSTTVICALSGRLDHTIAAIGAGWNAPPMSLRFWSPEFEGWMLGSDGQDRLCVSPEGRLVSLLAGPGGAVVTLEGFRYPLLRGKIPGLSSFGISNLTETSGATIEVHEGRLMAMLFGA